MPHYVDGQHGAVPRGEALTRLVAVCGQRYAHPFSFSDVASLIDCETCRDWIRKNEKDAHRLKLIENAWKGPAAKQPFWNEKDKRWDI